MSEARPSAELTCPKCRGNMRSFERNGIIIDQCTDCRGVFLDRGKLERLIDAEGHFYKGRPSEADERGGSGHGDSRRGGGFLGGLFGGHH